MIDALGIDTAGCNGVAYWGVAKSHNVRFGAGRATISWGYQDKWFPSNKQGMKDQGIHRFYYHILYPSQPFKPQAENFLRVVGDDWDDAHPVDDFELDQGCSKAQITDCILGWNEYVSARAPKVVNYSRKQWADTYTELGDWRRQYEWWLAQFLNDRSIEDPRPPDLPVGVLTYLIHQNADHYLAWPGFTPDSLNLDIDRWNGDDAAVDEYFGHGPVNPPAIWDHAITDWARTLGYTGPEPEQ